MSGAEEGIAEIVEEQEVKKTTKIIDDDTAAVKVTMNGVREDEPLDSAVAAVTDQRSSIAEISGYDNPDDEARDELETVIEAPAVVDDYWHQLAKESEGPPAATSYWHQMAEESEKKSVESQRQQQQQQVDGGEDAVVGTAAEEGEQEGTKVAAVAELRREEQDTAVEELPEVTEEEKAQLAERQSYWIAMAEEGEERHKINVVNAASLIAAEAVAAIAYRRESEDVEEEQGQEEETPNDEAGDDDPTPVGSPLPVAEKEEEEQASRKVVDPAERYESNIEVLNKLANEIEDEEEKSTVYKMLAWAKSSHRKKTDTFVIRAKKKEESIRKAIDYTAMDIVIEDSSSSKGKSKKKTNVDAKQLAFHDDSLNGQMSHVTNGIVTEESILNAIRSYEQVQEVEIESMRFEPKVGEASHEAFIKAKVGQAASRSYHWVIREAAKVSVQLDSQNKDTYMVSDLGSKIASFVASKKLKKSMTVPFQPVIWADDQYAILDDISDFKLFTDESGFNLDHMKQALRALAKLHAMSMAHFGSSSAQGSSEVLKLMIDRQYQPSATSEEKAAAKAGLEKDFETMLEIVRRVDKEGADLAAKAKAKFGNRLYDICKDANESTGPMSVLCHGFPNQQNIRFLYGDDHRPLDVKFTDFKLARLAHAVTDLQLLICTTSGPRVEEQEQTEFLLRYVYYEVLTGTLKVLDPKAKVVEFQALMEDFRNKQVFGCLMGAMSLAGVNAIKPVMNVRRATGKKVFESKLAGGKIGNSADINKVSEKSAAPVMRAKALLKKALSIHS